jgi:hypothetical protein
MSQTLEMNEVIKLTDQEAFGMGGRRICFVHPLEPDKCIKVLRTDDKRTIRVKKKRLVPTKLRRKHNNNDHEQKVLEMLHRQMGTKMSAHLPICHGNLVTDMGPGLVLDLIRDFDGLISRSLRELITLGHRPAEFRAAFNTLGRFLTEQRVLTRHLLDHNIVARHQSNGTWQLVIIDGLGDPAWLPVARWVPALAQHKIRRRLKLCWDKIETFAAKGGATSEMPQNRKWKQGILTHRGPVTSRTNRKAS